MEKEKLYIVSYKMALNQLDTKIMSFEELSKLIKDDVEICFIKSDSSFNLDK